LSVLLFIVMFKVLTKQVIVIIDCGMWTRITIIFFYYCNNNDEIYFQIDKLGFTLSVYYSNTSLQDFEDVENDVENAVKTISL